MDAQEIIRSLLPADFRIQKSVTWHFLPAIASCWRIEGEATATLPYVANNYSTVF